MKNNKTVIAYKSSQKMQPLFSQQGLKPSLPLTFEDSLTPVPNYPICAFGVLTAKGERGKENSIAFVVEDNYLLTCASNCFSHKHGLSSNITFTINSNRKAGYDTFKISKAFIPEQYKSIKGKRNDYNYALLYIEGDPKLKDKYGSIGINLQQLEEKKHTYFKLVTNNQGQLLSFGQFGLEQNVPISMGGGPLLLKNSLGKKQAAGLVFMQAHNSPPCFMLFDKRMYAQLAQWAQVPKGLLEFLNFSSNQLNVSLLKDEDRKPLQTVYLHKYSLNGKISSFFEALPCTTISNIDLCGNEINDNLVFLKQKKFRQLKTVSLKQNNIGPKGCQIIASFFLNNLRQLCLSENPILDQGCKHLSTAKWPFLTNLKLYNCMIKSDGLHYLMQQPRINLILLELGRNNFQNNLTKVLEKVQLPRIEYLHMSNAAIIAHDLMFLRSPSWKSLAQLILNDSPVGSKGCKMIKQADIPLKRLHLTNCRIPSYGVKWLCKANLNDIQILEINNPTMRNVGYLALSKVTMPKLQKIEMTITHATQPYMDYIPRYSFDSHLKRHPAIRWLLKTQWFNRTVLQPIAKESARYNNWR